MPNLNEIFTRAEVGHNFRIVPRTPIIIFGNQISGAAGTKALYDHVGLPAGFNRIAARRCGRKEER
jgi:hypothetical protein